MGTGQVVRSVFVLVAAAAAAGCAQARCCRVVAAEPLRASPVDPYAAAARAHGRGSAAVWAYLASRYDADRDGKIAAGEYPRDPKTFARLDRDHDGSLAPADFEGPTVMDTYIAALVLERIAADPPPPGTTPPDPWEGGFPDEGVLGKAFERTDANRNGLVGEGELDAALGRAQATPVPGVFDLPRGVRPFPSLLSAIDGDRSGRLTRDEVLAWGTREREREAVEEKEREAKAAEAKEAAAKDGTPSPRRKPPVAPQVGEDAPDFTLRSPDGAREVSLASFRGKRPVALVFGSYTCPPFRATGPEIRASYDRHGHDVEFLFVYLREAHAVDGRAPMPAADQPLVEEPRDLAERRLVASSCARAIGFDVFTTLVDGLDGAVDRSYAASPARLFVVGRDGKVLYASGRGPFGLDPKAFEAAVARAAAGP